MLSRTTVEKFWTNIPPWILLGAVAVLVPIFTFTTFENINRQKENRTRFLKENGAALIRSLEAGTRTWMMGTYWSSFKLQHLLTETAKQPDIRYLMVTDINGVVVADSDPKQNGRTHGTNLPLATIARSDPSTVMWRILRKKGKAPVFEVYRRFSPTLPPPMGMGQDPAIRAFRHRFQKLMEEFGFSNSGNWIIFVGLDMQSIEAAQRADMKHSIVMGTILLLIGFGGFVLLMLFQNNRATRLSLSRIKAFSDNMVENMPIGLVALDSEKTIATVNQVAVSMLGLNVTAVVGKAASEVLPAQIHSLIDRLDNEPEIIDCQIDCDLPDNRSLPLEATATFLKDETGQFFGYALLLKDLSEIQALRKEVARSQRLATVGRLAAGVAHEVRNPLSSIKGFATYFKERYPDVTEDQQIAGIMIQEVDKLNRVVGQLLEFARPVKIQQRWIPLKALVDDSLKLVEKQASDRGIRIRSKVTPAGLQGWIDPDRIHQVLLNLYLNAMDAMEAEGLLAVTSATSSDQQSILIRVSDTGPGIDPEDIANIFDPYYTTKPSGTGLGLAIVHNIIEAHHGRILANNQPGKGASITIYLPLPALTQKEERNIAS